MITASIVTYHTSFSEVLKVVDCVLKSTVSLLYIIDNSSNDKLREVVNLSDRIKYIHSANLGYGAGHNIAIQEAIEKEGKYHIVINPDIYFEEGILEQLEEYMDDHEDVGQVMPKVYYPDGQLQYLCKLCPSPIDLIFKRFVPERWMKKRLDKFQLKFTDYSIPMDVPYLSGCFMFFRIEALKKVGLFDERFFMYPEDIDITRRIHRCYKTMFYPNVSIVHAHAAASKTNKRMLRIHIVNMIKYFNKWGWVWDSERGQMNKKLLMELNYKK